MSQLPIECPTTDKQWRRCRRCRLYSTRRSVVLNRNGLCYRGKSSELTFDTLKQSKYPQILFIGEAPEETDDIIGRPFMGHAGRILNMIFSYTSTPFCFTLTNLVACRPITLDFREERINRTPTPEEMAQCRPRLDQLIESYHFSGVVYVGPVTQSYRHVLKSQPGLFTKAITITSPTTILKMEYKLYSIKKAAKQIENHVNTINQKRINSLHR